MGLPANLASTLLQQHVNSTLQGQGALAPLQVTQPIQVVTQSTNNVVAQRPPQNQVKFSFLYSILYKYIIFYVYVYAIRLCIFNIYIYI